MEASQHEAEEKAGCIAERAIVLSDNGMHLAAFWTRILSGSGISGQFDPVFVMEIVIPQFDPLFNYRIVEQNEWQHGESVPAYYSPSEHTIAVRSDVYNRAQNGNAVDIITVTHEVTHCIQSIVMKFLGSLKCLEVRTELCSADSPQMARHELQTDRMTSLVLRPEMLVHGRNSEELLRQYAVEPLMTFLFALARYAGKTLLKALLEPPATEINAAKEEAVCTV